MDVITHAPLSPSRPRFALLASRHSWVSILEKAMAKVHGSYHDLKGTGDRSIGTPAALRMLTGGEAVSFSNANPDEVKRARRSTALAITTSFHFHAKSVFPSPLGAR